ncbi:MAG: hypothetical protein K2Y39_04900 [Candidatus Obscuribacterales bacterium]|nr:hypothetical protein [Candidatus Obscuribacterales bacterium]
MTAVKNKRKKRPSLAWKDKYKGPNSKDNPKRYWVIPELEQIVEDLRACNGRVDRLLLSLSKVPHRQEMLLMQISELINRDPESDAAIEWQNLRTASRDAGKEMLLLQTRGLLPRPHVKLDED